MARVTIFGTGAMAMLLGARLSRSGAHVTLAGRWPETLDALRRRGIEVEDAEGSWSARVATMDLARELPSWTGAADLVLVLVKSHQTHQIAPIVARASGLGPVLTLQNGLGNLEALLGAGVARASQGVTRLGATVAAPGRVRAGGEGETVLSESDSAATELLRGAGFDCRTTSDLKPWSWLKLAVNCAINPLTACEGVNNGELLSSPLRRVTMETAAREVGSLACALGIALPEDPVVEAARVAFRTAANRSSMLQDVDRGAPTEIDAISGAVVRAGRERGVAMPINESLWRRVLALDTAAACRQPTGPA